MNKKIVKEYLNEVNLPDDYHGVEDDYEEEFRDKLIPKNKVEEIKKAIEKLAGEFGKEMKIINENPEEFLAGFEYRNNIHYFIEINDDYDGEYVAGWADVEKYLDQWEDFNSIEEAITQIKDWIIWQDENEP